MASQFDDINKFMARELDAETALDHRLDGVDDVQVLKDFINFFAFATPFERQSMLICFEEEAILMRDRGGKDE